MASVGYSNGSPVTQKRTISGAFNQLGPGLVRELKEAFTLIDKDGDDVISDMDLHEVLVSLGQTPDPQEIRAMLQEMPSPVTLSAFLTNMATHLSVVSGKEDMLRAFQAFETNGQVDCTELRSALIDQGMSGSDVDMVLSRFTKQSGFASEDAFMYKEFISQLRGD